MASQEDAGHGSKELLVAGGAHFRCKALRSSRHRPIYLLGHISLSSVSQSCAEARAVDPAKTCPWQRRQKGALKNKGSLADNWLLRRNLEG